MPNRANHKVFIEKPMKIFEKIKEWQGKWILLASILGLGTTGGLIPTGKWVYTRLTEIKEIVIDYPELVHKIDSVDTYTNNRIDSLEIRTKILENLLADYDIVKSGIVYLMKDNEVLSGLLRANMKKMDNNDYGTVLVVYDNVEKKYVRRLVEVYMRESVISGDLYVFISSVSWGEEFWGIPVTKKFAAKWHEDEKKYYYIDGDGEIHLIYQVDIESTIQK